MKASNVPFVLYNLPFSRLLKHMNKTEGNILKHMTCIWHFLCHVMWGQKHVVPLAIKKQLFSTPKAGSLFASEMRSLAEWDWLTSYMISGSLYIGNVQYFVNLNLPNSYLFQAYLLFQFSKFGLTDFENGRFFLFCDPSWSNWWLQKVGKSD